jgi:copper chaperone CopZ
MVIFPLLANVSTAQPNGILAINNGLSLIQLQVDIPCPGHASLITDELKKIDGVSGIQFSLPNVFNVTYDNSKTSKQQILELEVFKTYKATVLSEPSNQQVLALDQQAALAQQTVDGSCCGGSCSGSCGCGKR